MLLLTLLPLLAAARAEIMELLNDVPEGWRYIDAPRPEQRLHLKIAMTAPNPGLFEQTLYAISTPGHSKYGQYLKRDELKEMLRPKSEATTSVMKWLVDAGVNPESIAEEGEWINFVTPVEVANDLLDTTFGVYVDSRGQRRIRTLQYSVPDQIHNYIDMIQPTTRFGEIQPHSSQVYATENVGQPQDYASSFSQTGDTTATDPNAMCDGKTMTPDCIRAMYKIPQNLDIDNATSGFMAYVNYLEQYPRDTDLAEFTRDYFPRANGVTYTWDAFNNHPNLATVQRSSEGSTEANLNTQYLMSTGWPVNVHAYLVGGRGTLQPDLDQPDASSSDNEPFLDWLTFMLAQPDNELPHTISTSYGESEQSVPLAYRKKVCDMMGQLGARGVSLIFSSGNAGPGSACQSNDGKNSTRFNPMFPSACPYVTSVGAVEGIKPEVAIGFSSGGFSETWETPDYQKAHMQQWQQNSPDARQWQGLYNPNGRGHPDVSAQGRNFQIIDKDTVYLISGTSAAAPTFAGVISLLNAQRLKAGKKPLGFLNPWIYSSGYQGLVDVVDGKSAGCKGVSRAGLQTPLVQGAGWSAVVGWDPITGCGTPDYERLLPLAMAA